MKIREANRWDQPELTRMILDYRRQSPIEILRDCDNIENFHAILAQIWAGRGIVFVAERDSKLVGMLIAIIVPNVWDPQVLALQELAYWVDPEHRMSTAGYKLLKRYKEYGEQAKQDGWIEYYTISKMISSPDLKYDKLGFEKIEEMWRS